MCAAGDGFVNSEAESRPHQIYVRSIEAAAAIEYTHSEWVSWMQSGDYETDGSASDADLTSGDGLLDALKGKGKGKLGKGKGKGKG